MQTSADSTWFISAPANPTKQETITKLRGKISEYADIYPFQLPEFKVGTLDSLMVISDELVKSDQFVESVVLKMADTLRMFMKSLEEWKINLKVGKDDLLTFLTTFQWNLMKYRSDKTLKELADSIVQEVTNADTLIKTKLQAYMQTKSNLQSLQRKAHGNLAVRNLNDLVKKEHFVLDSEFLITVLVAVPKQMDKEWTDSYEKLTQMVVPRKIAEDDDFVLYTVTLFNRVLDEFTNKCKERRFVVRDFKWNAEELSNQKNALKEATDLEHEQAVFIINTGIFASLMQGQFQRVLCFMDSFESAENIYRVHLEPIVVNAKPKQERKTREILNRHYAYIDKNAGTIKSDSEIDDNMQSLLNDKDYSPVVLLGLNKLG